MEQLIILVLSAFILGIVAYFFIEKKKWEKRHKQDRTMIEEEKKLITSQKEVIEKLRIVEANFSAFETVYNTFQKELVNYEIAAINKKEELEYIAARSGMTKMDDGYLYRLIKSDNKFSRTLMSNWLPYGMQLGKLDLLEKLQNHFK